MLVEGLLEKEVVEISAGANHVMVITGNVHMSPMASLMLFYFTV